jgi:hypothetical protein
MRRLQVSTAALAAVALAGVLVNAQPTIAVQAACLHGPNEAPDQLARRQRAVALTRLINTLQLEALTRMQAYQALDKLMVAAETPKGFTVHLVSDGASYAFSVKDTLDPCHYMLFSDQEQLIYVGQPLR